MTRREIATLACKILALWMFAQAAFFVAGVILMAIISIAAIFMNISQEDGELTELYCRFTLPHRSRPALSEWSSLVVALCQRFQLRLAGDASICDGDRFVAAVRGNENYRDFA